MDIAAYWPDTPEDGARRKAAHASLAGHYQRLAAGFHVLMVECRDYGDPERGDYPYDSVVYFATTTAELNFMARSELGRCL